MADDTLGITTNDPMCLAVQISDGRWVEVEGVISSVDGYCHKIEFPGFMTRSGESFGVTATFHVLEKAWRDGDVDRGDISRLVMVNGLLMTAETVAKGVELLRQETTTRLEKDSAVGKKVDDPLVGVPKADLLEE